LGRCHTIIVGIPPVISRPTPAGGWRFV